MVKQNLTLIRFSVNEMSILLEQKHDSSEHQNKS